MDTRTLTPQDIDRVLNSNGRTIAQLGMFQRVMDLVDNPGQLAVFVGKRTDIDFERFDITEQEIAAADRMIGIWVDALRRVPPGPDTCWEHQAKGQCDECHDPIEYGLLCDRCKDSEDMPTGCFRTLDQAVRCK